MLGKRTRTALMGAAIAGAGAASLWGGVQMANHDAPLSAPSAMQDMVDMSVSYQIGTVEGLYAQSSASSFTGKAAEVRETFLQTAGEIRARGNEQVIEAMNTWRDVAFKESTLVYTGGQVTAMGRSAVETHTDLSKRGQRMVSGLAHAGMSFEAADASAASLIKANAFDGDHQVGRGIVRDLPVSMSTRSEMEKIYGDMDKSLEGNLTQFMTPNVAAWEAGRGMRKGEPAQLLQAGAQGDDGRLAAVRARAETRRSEVREVAQSPMQSSQKASKGAQIGD